MLKEIVMHVAQCDICDYRVPAQEFEKCRVQCYDVPEDWVRVGESKQFCICPKCWKKFQKEDKNLIGNINE